MAKSAKAEIDIFNLINSESYSDHVGHQNISHLVEKVEDTKDIWLVYELGGESLSTALFNVKGEFYKSERIYIIHHQDLYQAIKSSKKTMWQFLSKLFEAFDLLHKNGVVHSDIKSDNILVEYNGKDITGVKLIDFGSAFSFRDAEGISLSTPEYLPPEVLLYLSNTEKHQVEVVLGSMQIWSLDMWSVGALLLEIITGFPLWLNMKCRMKTRKGKYILGRGIFSALGRDWSKIYLKQKQLLEQSLKQGLKRYDTRGYLEDQDFMDLLSKLLEYTPNKRISAEEALNHAFISTNRE